MLKRKFEQDQIDDGKRQRRDTFLYAVTREYCIKSVSVAKYTDRTLFASKIAANNTARDWLREACRSNTTQTARIMFSRIDKMGLLQVYAENDSWVGTARVSIIT
jgi:hypothetical protein